MMPNYEQLIDKIAKSAGLSVEEVNKRVDAKCAKLSGLISKEGSAQIVASELGISFEKEKLKISELVSGMKRVSVVGKVINEPRINEFNKNGREGKVASMTFADDTSNTRLVLWDTNHIARFENSELKNGDVVEVSNASVRNDELHLGSFSEIKKSDEVLEEVKEKAESVDKRVAELKPGNSARVRGVIVQIFEPRFFDVSKATGRKPTQEELDNNTELEKRALIGLVIDDGSENMRGVLFNEQIKEIGFSDEELNNSELFAKKRGELLGEEMYFNVNVRTNNLFNNTEFIVNGIEKVEIENLIEVLK